MVLEKVESTNKQDAPQRSIGQVLKQEIHIPNYVKRVFASLAFELLVLLFLSINLYWLIFIQQIREEYTFTSLFLYGLLAAPIGILLSWPLIGDFRYRNWIHALFVTLCIGQFIIGPEGSLIPIYMVCCYLFTFPSAVLYVLSFPPGIILPFLAGFFFSKGIEKLLPQKWCGNA